MTWQDIGLGLYVLMSLIAVPVLAWDWWLGATGRVMITTYCRQNPWWRVPSSYGNHGRGCGPGRAFDDPENVCSWHRVMLALIFRVGDFNFFQGREICLSFSRLIP